MEHNSTVQRDPMRRKGLFSAETHAGLVSVSTDIVAPLSSPISWVGRVVFFSLLDLSAGGICLAGSSFVYGCLCKLGSPRSNHRRSTSCLSAICSRTGLLCFSDATLTARMHDCRPPHSVVLIPVSKVEHDTGNEVSWLFR